MSLAGKEAYLIIEIAIGVCYWGNVKIGDVIGINVPLSADS